MPPPDSAPTTNPSLIAPHVTPDHPAVVIAPTGDLDVSATDAVLAEVREQRAAGAEDIVIDLRRVGFLDSAGLRVQLALRNDAKRTRQHLTLVPGPPGVQRTFELTATRALFDWRGTPERSTRRPRTDRLRAS